MQGTDSDIVIVGGGLVGAALGLALIQGGRTVTLLENRPFIPEGVSEGISEGTEDKLDWRVYAISPENRHHLSQLKVWPNESRIQPISHMALFGDEGGHFRIDARDADLEALAWIVESRGLRAKIWEQLQQSDRAQIIPSSPIALDFHEERVSITLADRVLSTHLVVGADGARSWVRQAVGIEPTSLSYDQSCVVGNFLTERPHQGEATQWFRPDGVLAFLPLPKRSEYRGDLSQISLAWSCHPSLSHTLLSLSPKELGKWVATASQYHLGDLELLSPAQALPLHLMHLPRTVGKGCVLIGDAAHIVHPLAAQGVNLGFGDVWALSRILLSEAPSHWGDLSVLQRYEHARRKRVPLLQNACHALQVLFARSHPALSLIRNVGLELADHLPWAKRQLIRYATGSA